MGGILRRLGKTLRVLAAVVWASLQAGSLASPLFAAAEIYTYIDYRGFLYYTNRPTTSSDRILLEQPPTVAMHRRIPRLYDTIIHQACQTHDVEVSLIKAVIKVESDYDPRAVSKAGAKGLMQLMPENIRLFRLRDPFDPRGNILAGTGYLKGLIQRFDGNLLLALAAYNAGPGNVEKYNDIPPFKETLTYVQQVMGYYHVLKREVPPR